MSKDYSLEVQKAVLTALKSDASLTALVPPDRIVDYVKSDIQHPFIRYGVDIVTPFEASGLDGCNVRVTIHAFTMGKGKLSCKQIIRAIHDTLDHKSLSLDAGKAYWVAFIQSTILEMGNDEYHGIIEFKIIAA